MSSEQASSERPARLPRHWLRTPLLFVASLAGLVLLLAAPLSLWVRHELRGSLPLTDGEHVLEGLRGPVVVERDALGVPTIYAADPLDLSRAMGFLHGQDRFFQMDLSRRRAAGELAELVGPGAVALDRSVRRHRFRALATRVLETVSPRERRLLEAYTAGVNQGLATLSSRPFEYLLLRTEPATWRAEDSILVVLAMYLQLQDDTAWRERARGVMRDAYPGPFLRFLTWPGTEWDAPLIGDALPVPPIPGPEVFDLRSMEPRPAAIAAAASAVDDEVVLGSNNWAVAGARTAHGGAMVANDMHLPMSIPNIWYRAAHVWPVEPGNRSAGVHRAVGVTLPGTPSIIAGSNGAIAWGFTNTQADWVDAVPIETPDGDSDFYRTPDGPQAFERHRETIRVKGAEDQTLEIEWTIWGPVMATDHRGSRVAVRWVAHEPDAVNLALGSLASARSLEAAIEIAQRVGAPAQNIVIAAADGRIAWTVMGLIPRRVGCDGELPQSRADGNCRWEGWLEPAEYPLIVDPADGLLWTANNRTVDGEQLRVLGAGSFVLGARARQIRDGLFQRSQMNEVDLLELQLDDRALFLERWRELLLSVLDDRALAGDPRRAELREIVESGWTGRASIDSTAYRLVRGYRNFVADRVLQMITAPCRELDPEFRPGLMQWEGPLWRLLSERPDHLLDPGAGSWEELLLAAVDRELDYFDSLGEPLAQQTWGRRNTVRVAHALSSAVPLLSFVLDMETFELPGGTWTPRVQSPGAGASQRMVVAPGHEEAGIFHMPGGQSGHPLSPHYRDAHAAWARGEATPFLPGSAVHVLKLSGDSRRHRED